MEGAIKKDNPEKLATWGTQDEEKQNKNTTQYVLDTTMRKHKSYGTQNAKTHNRITLKTK